MKKLLSLLCVMFIFAATSLATTSIKLSLWQKIALPSDDYVHGFELGIGTYTPKLRGLAINLICSKTDDAVGCQSGIVSISKKFAGYQKGCLNISESFVGVECGLVNLNNAEFVGVQLGYFNKTKYVKGIQFGFINVAENMHGIQIGFLNFIATGKFPAMVIANAKF